MKGKNILHNVPLVYNAVLQELPGWDPRTQTETDAQGKQVPLTLPRFLMRVTSKYFNRLTREPEPTEMPVSQLGKGEDSEGNPTPLLDPSERAEASLIEGPDAAEEEHKHRLAGLSMARISTGPGRRSFSSRRPIPP